MARLFAAECFGTFWLVLGGCGAAVLAAAFPQMGIGFVGVAFAFGLSVLTMAYAVGHISGAHFNPAVTAGFLAAFESFFFGAALTATSMAVLAGFVGGFVGALIVTGSLSAALTAGLISGATAGLFNFVGGSANTPGAEWSVGERVIAHAAVGCVAGAASSGNCGKGALSAAASEYLGSQVLHGNELSNWGTAAQTAKYALIGGLTNRISGGDFVEGFSIGAAGYLFNDLSHTGASASASQSPLTSDTMPQMCFTPTEPGGSTGTFVYQQSTGELDFTAPDGSNYYVGNGYSGNGAGLNNPNMQYVPFVGTIPQGIWLIGPQQDNGTLLSSMRLTPSSGTYVGSRDPFSFLIHGANQYTSPIASTGCIVANSSIRNAIGNSGATRLQVVGP
jgi:glycerol uptake facilitator-like aquaporin